MCISASLEQDESPRSWGEYYSFSLTWRQHRTNIIGHWPLIRRIVLSRTRRALEIGTGTGSMSSFISYLVPRVTSVDIEPSILEHARQNAARVRGRVRFVQADAFDLPYEDQSWDVAFSQGFFEHFDDDAIERLLREQLRVARKVIFSVPNATYGRQDFGDERLLTRREWEDVLNRMGLPLAESLDYAPLRKRFWREPRVHYLAVLDPRSRAVGVSR